MSEPQKSPNRTNTLGDGVTEQQLLEAVSRSGYPFQAEVTDRISEFLSARTTAFDIEEEWAFVDSDSGTVRAIDALARIHFRGPKGTPIPFTAHLLVECKQSSLPYVCFVRPQGKNRPRSFPPIAGLIATDLALHVEGEGDPEAEEYSPEGARILMSTHDTLAVWDTEFFNEPCPFAVSISKAARRGGSGSRLELTGEDAYRSITLPLLKAGDYLYENLRPKKKGPAAGFFPILELAVISGPLYAFERNAAEGELRPINWLRACRLEPGATEGIREEGGIRYFDVIHESYLESYLSQMQDALKQLMENAALNDVVLWAGRARVRLPDLREPPHGFYPFEQDARRARRFMQPHRSDDTEEE